MCLAIPGKIIEKKGGKVVVDYGDRQVVAGVIECGKEISSCKHNKKSARANIAGVRKPECSGGVRPMRMDSAANGDRPRYSVGDYVIVQGGVVIEKVPLRQVKKWIEFIKSSS